jgi:hypothetical protein
MFVCLGYWLLSGLNELRSSWCYYYLFKLQMGVYPVAVVLQ